MPGIVICGEGLNDLYYDELGGQSGPLKICLDKLLEFFWDDASYINFFPVSRAKLADTEKGKPEKRTSIVRGLKKDIPDAKYVSICAKLLAKIAQEKSVEFGDDWGVVFFRDLDASSGNDVDKVYKAKVAAMDEGFASVQFENGVPMIPKTRSESWLLCALNPSKAAANHYYEYLPMSDKSPNSGKKILAKELGVNEDESYKVIYERIDDFCWEQIKAESFVAFMNRFKAMSGKILGFCVK